MMPAVPPHVGQRRPRDENDGGDNRHDDGGHRGNENHHDDGMMISQDYDEGPDPKRHKNENGMQVDDDNDEEEEGSLPVPQAQAAPQVQPPPLVARLGGPAIVVAPAVPPAPGGGVARAPAAEGEGGSASVGRSEEVGVMETAARPSALVEHGNEEGPPRGSAEYMRACRLAALEGQAMRRMAPPTTTTTSMSNEGSGGGGSSGTTNAASSIGFAAAANSAFGERNSTMNGTATPYQPQVQLPTNTSSTSSSSSSSGGGGGGNTLPRASLDGLRRRPIGGSGGSGGTVGSAGPLNEEEDEEQWKCPLCFELLVSPWMAVMVVVVVVAVRSSNSMCCVCECDRPARWY